MQGAELDALWRARLHVYSLRILLYVYSLRILEYVKSLRILENACRCTPLYLFVALDPKFNRN